MDLAATGALFRSMTDLPVLESIAKVAEYSPRKTGVERWTEFVLMSAVPLVGEPVGQAHYEYRFLLRLGSMRRFLLVSSHSDLVNSLLRMAGLDQRVRRPRVRVDQLVEALAESPSRYVLSAAHARVAGYGHNLRRAAFWGNDLAEAGLFRQTLPSLTAYRVTLRDPTTRSDVLSVGEDGGVGFGSGLGRRLKETDDALNFLSARGFLDWGEPDAEGGDVGA